MKIISLKLSDEKNWIQIGFDVSFRGTNKEEAALVYANAAMLEIIKHIPPRADGTPILPVGFTAATLEGAKFDAQIIARCRDNNELTNFIIALDKAREDKVKEAEREAAEAKRKAAELATIEKARVLYEKKGKAILADISKFLEV